MVSEPFPSTASLGCAPLEPWLELYGAATFEHYVNSAFRILGSLMASDFISVIHRQPEYDYCSGRDSRGRVWSAAAAREQAELALEWVEKNGSDEVGLMSPRLELESREEAGERARCRELMTTMAFQHAATLLIALRGNRFSLSFSFYRSAGAADFSTAELDLLIVARRYLERGWCLLHERVMAHSLVHGISSALRHYQRGVVILDVGLHLLWANRAARASIQFWEHPDRRAEKPGREMARLPALILEACLRLAREWQLQGGPAWPTSCSVALPSAPAHSASVRLFGGRAPGVVLPNFLVEFQHTGLDCEEVAQGESSFRDSLTSSENEIVALVCEGFTNQEIADRLGKSLVAVKFHLHRIFKKAQVKTRTKLSVLLGRSRL